MNTRNLLLLACLCFSITLSANNGNPSASPVTSNLKTAYSLNKIFFNDFENDYIFVDFEPVTDNIIMINLWRDGELMMEDDVTDLPSNTIYELNTGLFRSGKYTIELVTLEGVKIHKKHTIE